MESLAIHITLKWVQHTHTFKIILKLLFDTEEVQTNNYIF